MFCAWKKGGIRRLIFGASNVILVNHMTLDTPKISRRVPPFFQAQMMLHVTLSRSRVVLQNRTDRQTDLR